MQDIKKLAVILLLFSVHKVMAQAPDNGVTDLINKEWWHVQRLRNIHPVKTIEKYYFFVAEPQNILVKTVNNDTVLYNWFYDNPTPSETTLTIVENNGDRRIYKYDKENCKNKNELSFIQYRGAQETMSILDERLTLEIKK